MKFLILALFLCWTCTAAVHLDCFGHVCDGHKSKCLVNRDHGITGRCEDLHMCSEHDACTANHVHEHGPHHECCCTDQSCIDTLKAAQSAIPHLTCFGQTCDSFNSVCLINKEHQFTGRCEAPEHCHHHEKCTASLEHVHGHGHDCCCMDQQCVDNLSSGTSIQQSGLQCLGHTCHGEEPYCRIHEAAGHLTGHCVEEPECTGHHRHICTDVHDTHGREGCCCQHHTCISTITGTHHATTTNTTVIAGNQGILTFGLQCSECSDIASNTCVHDHITCGVNEVCKIKQALQGAVSTQCQSILQCAGDKVDEAKLPNQPQSLCCGSDACTTNAVKNMTAGHLTCPVCNNQFLGDCHGDHLCSVGETCMFEAKNGMLSTKCSSSCPQQQGNSANIVCCSDNYCVGNSIKHFHQASFVCPRCTDQSADDCLANTITCSGTNGGCSVVETGRGFTVGCTNSMSDCMAIANKNSADCALASPLGNTTACQSCCQKDDAHCIRQAFTNNIVVQTTVAPVVVDTTVVQTPQPTTGAPAIIDTTVVQPSQPTTVVPAVVDTTVVQSSQPATGGCPPFDLACPQGCATYDVNLCPMCAANCGGVPSSAAATTSDPATVAPIVTSTPAATMAPKVCIDSDPTDCQALHATLCTANDPNIHHLAVVTCAKSCGFCDEYLQLDMTTTPAPPVTTTPKVTTTAKVCIDTDPDSCLRMQDALCPATDPNLHHMAVVTCAKTCDFCDEFMLV